jgi:WD40 repeat protein
LWELYYRNPCLVTIRAHAGRAATVVFSPDGTVLASCGADGAVRLWNAPSGNPLFALTGHDGTVRTIRFHPDAHTSELCSGGSDATIKRWDLKQRRCIATLVGHDGEVREVAYSPDGRVLASASVDRTVKLWNVTSGKCTNTFDEHESSVDSVCFSRDGRWLASTSADKTIIRDAETGVPAAILPGAGLYGGVKPLVRRPD